MAEYKNIEDFKAKNPELVEGKSPKVVEAMYVGALITNALEPGSKGHSKIYTPVRIAAAIEANPGILEDTDSPIFKKIRSYSDTIFDAIREKMEAEYGGTPEEIQERRDRIKREENRLQVERRVIEQKAGEVSQYEKSLAAKEEELNEQEEEIQKTMAMIEDGMSVIEEWPDIDYFAILRTFNEFNSRMGQKYGEKPLEKGEADIQFQLSENVAEYYRLKEKARMMLVTSPKSEEYYGIARGHENVDELELANQYIDKAMTELKDAMTMETTKRAEEEAAKIKEAEEAEIKQEVRFKDMGTAELYIHKLKGMDMGENTEVDYKERFEHPDMSITPSKPTVLVKTTSNSDLEAVRNIAKQFTGKKGTTIHLSEEQRMALMGAPGPIGSFVRYRQAAKRNRNKLIKKKILSLFEKKAPYYIEETEGVAAVIEEYMKESGIIPQEKEKSVLDELEPGKIAPVKAIYEKEWGMPALGIPTEELKEFLDSGEIRDDYNRGRDEAITDFVMHVAQENRDGNTDAVKEANETFSEVERAELLDTATEYAMKKGRIPLEFREVLPLLQPNGHKGKISTYRVLSGLEPSVQSLENDEAVELGVSEYDPLDEFVEEKENGEAEQ